MKSLLLPAKFLLLFLGVALPFVVSAQQTPRHLLGSRYSRAAVAEMLVPHAAWKPYPRTPAEWQAAVPAPVREKLIKAGEAVADFKFEGISATVSLDYVRTGDRTRHSRIANAKRDALLQLVLAESLEGQGRGGGCWTVAVRASVAVRRQLRRR